jgi:hypothetical protein
MRSLQGHRQPNSTPHADAEPHPQSGDLDLTEEGDQMAAPVGPKKVHRYTLEFKIQAVKLANHPGDPDAGRRQSAGYSSVHAREVKEGPEL